VPQHEDAFEVVPRQRRAGGGRARRQHERVVADLALALRAAHAQHRLRRQKLDRLAFQFDFYRVPLAEVFGRVEDERIGRGDEPGDDVREPAGAV
jgi:hypothetical protein